ncbi:hypothetical protein BH10PAT1_BH10PAT1_4470 [soil metagenome]
MRFDRDPFAFQKQASTLYGTDNLEISGFSSTSDNKIYLNNNMPLRGFLSTYFHETGHYMGVNTSFREILSPKMYRTTQLNISKFHKAILFRAIMLKDNPIILRPFIFNIANQTLNLFFRNNFDPNMLDIHILSPDKLKSVFMEGEDVNGYTYKNDREIRNLEVDAFTVQVGCLKIIENTLKSIDIPISGSTPTHTRAINIVSRAFYRNTNISSTFDRKNPYFPV